ncbi:hypothetical protein [Vibrio mexicanus]|uniref:hypothetical protein n=1 Tax=Vibrio mexicanus TaxID=1004326 RepID=UPI000699582C|nr:hypothetical protein [Vibrio mexicanus]
MKPIRFAMCLLAVTYFLPAHSHASRTTDNLSFGGVQTRVSDDGFQDYFGEIYNNEGSKYLFGLYFGGNIATENSWYVNGGAELATRSSTTINQAYLTVGHIFEIDSDKTLFLGGGLTSQRSERRLSCKKDEIIAPCDREYQTRKDYAAMAEVGLEWNVNPRWDLVPAYQYRDVYDRGLHQVRFDNHFKLSKSFGLEAGYGYVWSRNLSQNDVRFGLNYEF